MTFNTICSGFCVSVSRQSFSVWFEQRMTACKCSQRNCIGAADSQLLPPSQPQQLLLFGRLVR